MPLKPREGGAVIVGVLLLFDGFLGIRADGTREGVTVRQRSKPSYYETVPWMHLGSKFAQRQTLRVS